MEYKRVLARALHHWYVVAFCIVLSIVAAYLVNRYSTKIYPVTASLIVKEVDDISGAELLYNNPLINFKRNYLNEIYILKSYPLVQRVVEDLNFDVAFYREGNILTTEAYDYLPVDVIPMRDSIKRPVTFDFQTLDAKTFQLRNTIGNNPGEWKTFSFGDTIQFGDFRGQFMVSNKEVLISTLNLTLIFSYSPAVEVATQYIATLNAEWAEEGAGIINLSMNGSNPEKAKDFMTGLIAQYQKNDLEIKNEAATRTVEFISEQLEGISDSLRQVERELERFKDQNVVTDLKGEALRLYGNIEEFEMQKAQLNISRNYYDYLIDYIQRNQDLHQIILPTSVGITDPILSNLVSQMNALQLDIKMLGKAENPLVSESVRRINEMKKDIIESVRNQISTDKIKLLFLNKQIAQIERQLGQLPLAERTLVSIQRNYALQENLYIFLLQKRSEAAISKASNSSDIVIVNPPRAEGHISPRTTRNYVLAVIVGTLIPLLAFLLLEVFNNQVQSREDIDRLTDIPIIGGIGHKKMADNLVVFQEPKSMMAESFRALRSNLNYFVRAEEKNVFLITSSISGEGKTFTSMNLASVLALSGKKTLIVGADMRKPKIFGDFGLENGFGLSTYLAGLADFEHVKQRTPYDNLDLVSGGPIPPNPAELLLTARMTSFIAEAKSQYDCVILDTPPMVVVTDAIVLSNFANHCLFVVRQNYTPRQLLETAQEYYASGKMKNISIVLNDILRSGPGYGYAYGYGYGYGYAYGNRDKYVAGYLD